MKICKDCKKEKQDLDFYPTQGDCKDCFCEKVRKNRAMRKKQYQEYDKNRQRNNYKRIFAHRYSGMLARIEGRSTRKYKVENRAICTRAEFYKWCEQNIEVFKKIHQTWEKSNWDNKYSPSIDRIDNSKGYTINNIRWLSKTDNCKKYDS